MNYAYAARKHETLVGNQKAFLPLNFRRPRHAANANLCGLNVTHRPLINDTRRLPSGESNASFNGTSNYFYKLQDPRKRR